MSPFVSVIIPCRNEARFIERCLDSIRASPYPGRLEIIVADGMSTDGTRDLLDETAARDPRLRIVDNPGRITPIALNLAIAAAHGEIILRFDAHATMPTAYIGQCVRLLETSQADNVGGTIRTIPQADGPFSRPITAVLSSRFGVGNSAFRTTSGETNARQVDTVFGGCWRRETLARLGGFNERLIRSQDIEFNLRLRRAGGTILLDPQIVCDYYARATLASFLVHNFRNGVWAVLPFAFSDIVPVRWRHLIPLAFVVSLAVSTALPFPWSIAVATAYAVANLAASVDASFKERRWTHLALMPIAFTSLHLAYGLGSALGCLKLASLKLRALSGASPKHASRIET
jgi:glycosyltransferase involved in cell wall biosynthesis